MSYSLRDLPLPVKVVASVFLMAVGLGYTSAMVQLHMQDSKSGKPMPTVDDVIRKYTGKVKYDANNPPPPPVSRLEALVTAETVAISGASMSGAFTTDDRAKGELKFANAIKGKTPEQVKEIEGHRKGEQLAFKLWINTPDAQRREAYTADKFVPPAGEMPKALTPAFKDGSAIKIKSIIDNRCVTCHSKGGEKEDPALDTYDGLLAHMRVNTSAPSGDWVKVEEPISTTKLTQSTHAHLLSFAVLFSLTGLVFAFSSYPTGLRCVLGPWVVIAVVADVSLWWLARLSDHWGPYFAMGIIGTGMLAGAGLFGQIVLSLFNMYGTKGKVVIGGLLVLGAAIAGLMWVNVFEPGMRSKTVQIPPVEKKDEPKTNGSGDTGVKPKDKPPESPWPPANELDRLLSLPVRDENGKPIPLDKVKWNGRENGSMVPAFFEKDDAYQKVMDDAAVPQAVKDKLRAERQAELDTVVAWERSPEAARKAAYETNAFDPPPAAAGKVTTRFVKDGKVQIKSIIDARCAVCHAPEQKQEEYPLDTYEGLSNYLQPLVAPPAP